MCSSLAVNNVIEQKQFTWAHIDIIRAKAQTFFTHADLKSIPQVNRNVSGIKGDQGISTRTSKTPSSKDKEHLCRNWNYYNNCSCNKTDPEYKNSHKCRVCEADTHPMLHCSRRRMAIPLAGGHSPSQ